MVTSGIKLTVRDVELYLFCPMVFYYSSVLCIDVPKGYWADLGKEIEMDVDEKIKREFEVFAKDYDVESERLCVRGKIDYVVKTDFGLAPLEVKYSRSLKPWWKYVAVLYAMLLEDSIKRPVKVAYLYLTESDRFVRVMVGDCERNYIGKVLKSCIEIINGKPPKPFKSKSCLNCDYRHLCP